MAPRPNWKGYLKLSLVSCPVALFPATTTSERVSFRTLNRATGNRLRRQLVDEQTGDVVEADDQVKGYEVGQGRVHPGRGRRDQVGAGGEQPHHRHRAVRAPHRGGRALSRHAVLSDADGPGGRGGVRRDPRRHARREDGGACPRGAVPARAHRHAGAARQGHHRHQPALRQRGAPGGQLLRRDPRSGAAQADAGAGHAHHRQDDGQVRAGEVR